MSLLSDIEHAYGIQVRKCKKVKDVYRIETKQSGPLCLKQYHVSAEDIQFIAAIQSHLTQSGFLYSPRILLTREQKPSFQKDGAYYMLTNWVDGCAPLFKDENQLKRGVHTLAHFHRYAKRIACPIIPDTRIRVWNLENRFRYARQVVETGYNTDTARQFAIIELCEQALEQLANAHVHSAIEHEARVRAFVHGDYNYPNLVVDEHGRNQLIDFDNTSCYVRMEDLAHIIHRNRPWNVDGAFRLIEEYDHVRPIRKGDFHLLITLLYEPYPLVRAIKQKRRHPGIVNPTVPRAYILKRYSRQLYARFPANI
jgi:CotS family spore coat protein